MESLYRLTRQSRKVSLLIQILSALKLNGSPPSFIKVLTPKARRCLRSRAHAPARGRSPNTPNEIRHTRLSRLASTSTVSLLPSADRPTHHTHEATVSFEWSSSSRLLPSFPGIPIHQMGAMRCCWSLLDRLFRLCSRRIVRNRYGQSNHEADLACARLPSSGMRDLSSLYVQASLSGLQLTSCLN